MDYKFNTLIIFYAHQTQGESLCLYITEGLQEELSILSTVHDHHTYDMSTLINLFALP